MKHKRSFLGILAAAVMAAALLAGCQDGQEMPSLPTEAAPISTEASTVPPTETQVVETEPTEPPPTCPPDGNPDDVTCKGSYTKAGSELMDGCNDVVATVGEKKLTNALLQIYYQAAVGAYQKAGHDVAPDFTQELDTQLCPLEGTAITWQQYFLQQALNSWHSHVTLIQYSESYHSPLEEAYQPNEKLHADNLKTRIYNQDLLYGFNTEYRIAEAHQAYLDSLPAVLEELAAANGCKTAASLANRMAGVSTSDAYLLRYAQLLNEAYMFATTLSYYIEPTPEEIEAYFAEKETAYAQAGLTREDSYANLRHILLIPADATIAEDGTVTATDESWEACLKEAEALLKTWKKTPTEIAFSELAFANSADTGSSVNGGLYSNLSRGQLMEELDAWCFDEARQTGDVDIIRTAYGYHLVYMSESTPVWYLHAEEDLTMELMAQEISRIASASPMSVDYSAISLGTPGDDVLYISAGDLLYPDIGHERYSVAPLYLQQDYPETMYGAYGIVTHGCGITTMSMLVSYMTDEEWTPPEMCALYGSYNGLKGTAHSMFNEVPAMHDFYVRERVFTWKEAQEALEAGYMVVTLQKTGYWTRGGHYLLLHNSIETEEGPKVQVRDSNIYNYRKLDGHTIGYFDYSTIPGGSRCYWVYEKKVTHYDACARCAEPTEESYVPDGLLREDYICARCDTALLRRNGFLNGCAVRVAVPQEEPEAPEETLPEQTVSGETGATEVPGETAPTESGTAETESAEIPAVETAPAESTEPQN